MSISQAEFARQVGHSRQYIHKLIRQGKLSTDEKGRVDDGKAFEEFRSLGDVGHSATREWNKQQKQGAKSKHSKATKGSGGSGEVLAGENGEPEGDFADPAVQEAHRVFNKSKAKEKAFASLLRELDYHVRKGNYVPVSEVKQEAEQVVSAMVSVLDSLPSRLAPRLTQRESLPEIQEIIEDGINEVKQAIQEEMERIETLQGGNS